MGGLVPAAVGIGAKLLAGAKVAGTVAAAGAKAHPIATAVGLGAASTGVQAISAIRQNNAQMEAQNRAADSARQFAALQAQQATQAQQNADAQTKMIEENIKARRDAFAALTKPAPAPDTSPLKGLATIATSPLGDTSEANIGRKKLLGN